MLRIDEAAKQRIEAAVRAAELRTCGEIVPVIVERSDAYPEAQDRGGIAAAVIATVVFLSLPHTWVAPEAEVITLPFGFHLPMLVVVQAVAFVAGWFVARWDPLERVLIGKKALAATAKWRARIAFREHGLQNTKDGTGVLLFLAAFEHQVIVLGDHGIHAKIGDEGWRAAVAALLAGVRSGDPAGGFEKAIGLVGEELARSFPRAEGDVNELPDSLRT